MKHQEKKKESVLGTIKKYKIEEKENPMEKKESSKKTERQSMSVWSGLRVAVIIFYCKIGSRKENKSLL